MANNILDRDNENPEKRLMTDYAARMLINVRKELSLTQTELAEIISFKAEKPIDVKTVYRWEKNIAPVPAWVLLHLDMLRKEFELEKTGELTKKAVINKKETLVASVLNKVRDKLKRGI